MIEGRAAARATAILAAVLALAGCASGPASSAQAPSGQPAPSAPAGTPSPSASPEEVSVQRDLVYETVAGESLALDAYLPAHPLATPTPAIVVVHGGSFTSGDKSGLDAAPLAAVLAQAGYAAFSIDYRLLPEHPFPAALEDLQAAVTWLRQPAQVARFSIDPARIGAFGGSAGAILVAEAGTAGEGPLDEGSRLKAVVELSGILDLTPTGLPPDLAAADRRLGLAYLDCTDPDDCPAATAASPLANVDPTDPPFYLGHSVDEELPEQSAIAFADALTAAGIPNQLDLRPGSAHSVLMLDSAMSERILAFFAQHL